MRRAGSVTLRRGESTPSEPGNLLDPANQSLADALRVMLRLLQAGMVVLGVLYVLSGLQSVKEGEKGIRLLFGKVSARDLDPGFHWSAPYPLGELSKVNRGYQEFQVDKEFWVYVPEGTVDASPDKLAPTQSLKPDQGGSGSVLTADGNVAHTRWRVAFHRDDVSKFAENVLPQDEGKVVRAAVKRGVVQACARVTIDELLKQSTEQETSVLVNAKRVAQDMLDRMNSGLVIDSLALDQAIPPLAVRGDFAKAQSAVSQAAKAYDEAVAEGNQRLNRTAGDVAKHLVEQINAYELSTTKQDKAAMEATLAAIDEVLAGKAVAIAGQERHVSGEVTTVLNDARRYRSEVMSSRKGDLARFNAKVAQFNANPLVMVHQEWSDAMRTFMSRDSVQLMLMPAGIHTISLGINSDPGIMREMDKARKLRERNEAERLRQLELRRDEFKTDTGLQTLPG